MKTGTLATRLMLAAILLTILVYFGINMAAYFNDPYTAAPAYHYTSEHSVTVSGYVVRDEEPLQGGGELVYASRREGERVSPGGTVALIYQSAQALSDANTLRSLNEQLEQLLYARSLVTNAQTTVRLDEEIAGALTSFHRALAAGDLSAAGETGSSLRTSILKRSYAYTGTEDLEASIAALQSQISALAAAADPNTTRIAAPKGGLFSSLVDGYETVLTPERLSSMTAGEYRSLAPGQAGGVGKMIYGSTWSFVTLVRSADLGRLSVGDTVTLRFQTGLDRELTMTVERIGDEDGGQRLLVLSSQQFLSLTTLLRHQNAQIVFNRYTGLRVPRSAVRILWEAVTDEEGQPVYHTDGTAEERQVTGVYCLWGDTAKFKPVDVLWQEDEYLLVAPVQGVDSLRRLRAGDEVITAAADLYDGKVVK